MRLHHNRLGIDPNQIVAVGTSAGGYLALMTAFGPPQPGEMYNNLSSRPNAIIAIAPILASSDSFELPPSMSPWVETPSAPPLPILILQGTNDQLEATLYSTTVSFAARTIGCVLVPFPGADHNTITMGTSFLLDLFIMHQDLRALGYVSN
jgi:acetyl esterase/lipase